MSTKAQIDIKVLRSLQIGSIPVIDVKGKIKDEIRYPIVGGVMLVPLSDADVFNLSSSVLRKKIKRGELTAYEQDGTIRKANANTNIYFNPKEYFQLQ